VKEKLKDLVRAIWRSSAYRGILLGLDRLAYVTAKRAKSEQPYTLLLAPPTGENIGDQAMFDSAIHNTRGNVVAVTMSTTYRLPVGEDEARTRVIVLAGHIHRPPLVRFGVVRRFGGLVKGAQALIAPGADTVDGGHTHGSLARLSLLRLGALEGIPTILQGFSWKADAPTTVRKVVADLARRGVQVSPRDPVSNRRLQASGVEPTTQVADLAFCYPKREELPADLARHVEQLAGDDRPVVLLNTSGLINRRHDLVADYGAVVNELHERGARIIFTPHVDRSWDDDFAMARKVHAAFGNGEDYVVEQLLSPAQVRNLATYANLVVTGRMHLAILSLSQTTPVICLATHGKVEGLFEFFELPDLVVEPRPGCGEQLVGRVAHALDHADEIRTQLDSRLPGVVEFSRQNFALLESDQSTAVRPA